jgi:type I restriction enzyme M protein
MNYNLSHKIEIFNSIDKNPVNLFLNVHKKLASIDGLLPEAALVEICKLISVKVYDEKRSEEVGAAQFDSKLYENEDDLVKSIKNLYVKTNSSSKASPLKLSNAAICCAVKYLEKYTITSTDADLTGRAFQEVIDKIARKTMGQFFTPDVVINFMIEVIRPDESLILDPFCGSGNMLFKTGQYLLEKQYKSDPQSDQQPVTKKLFGIEKNQSMVSIFRANAQIRNHHYMNIHCGDALAGFDKLPAEYAPQKFDILLTNPPFGANLPAKVIKQLGHFDLASHGKGVPVAVLGLERSILFLKPGGKLGIVIPDGLLSGKHSARVRAWLVEQLKISAIISLPLETFSPNGANIKTSILFGRKWKGRENIDQDYEVFLGKINHISDDASGRPAHKVDIDNVKHALHLFLDEKGW